MSEASPDTMVPPDGLETPPSQDGKSLGSRLSKSMAVPILLVVAVLLIAAAIRYVPGIIQNALHPVAPSSSLTLLPQPNLPTRLTSPPSTGFAVYGGSGEDRLLDIATGADGSVVAVGYTTSTDGDFPPSHGGEDALVVRKGATGETKAQTLGGSLIDVFQAVTVAPNGNIIAVGYTRSRDGDFQGPIGALQSALVACLSPDLNLLWYKLYGGSGLSDVFMSVAILPDGSLIVGGLIYPASSIQVSQLNDHFFPSLAKLSSSGEIIWTKQYGNSNASTGINSIAITRDGNIVAGGTIDVTNKQQTPNPSPVQISASIMSVDEDGNTIWSYDCGASLDNKINSVDIMADGSILVAGTIAQPNGEYRSTLVKVAPDGSREWQKPIDYSGTFTFATELPDGSIVAVGHTLMVNYVDDDRVAVSVPYTLPVDALLAHFSSTGNTLQTKTFGGDSLDIFKAMTITSQGMIIAVGFTYSSNGDFPNHNGESNSDAVWGTITP